MLKASVKRWVFNKDLKAAREQADLRGGYTTTDLFPTAHLFVRLGLSATRKQGFGPQKLGFPNTHKKDEDIPKDQYHPMRVGTDLRRF